MNTYKVTLLEGKGKDITIKADRWNASNQFVVFWEDVQDKGARKEVIVDAVAIGTVLRVERVDSDAK